MTDINDVFVSYRRVDVDFAKRLTDALKDAGKEVWIDWEDIPPGSDSFEEDIQRGLEATDAFIAILSPEYLESTYCVDMELQYALDLNKRVIPVVIREFDDSKIPTTISHINWIHFIPHAGRENTFDESINRVVEAINTDLEHVREHKRVLVRALEWKRNDRQPSYLLSGDEITRSEAWIARAANRKPIPTELHQEYIIASRDRSQRQLRRLFAGVTSALVIMTILVFISLFLFNSSRINANNAATQAVRAENNAATATNAQGEALDQRYIAETQAANAATNAELAANNASTADANAVRAANNAATATNAQGDALVQRYIAETQAVRAENNAVTATNAQGEALEQRYNAETQAAIAATNAIRAENNAATADANAIRADNNAATATIAQGEALDQRYIAETQAAIAQAERSRAQSIALAAQADAAYKNNQVDRAALLAIAAVENYEYTVEAERALSTVYQNDVRPQSVNTFDVNVASIHFAPSSGAYVMLGRDGSSVHVGADTYQIAIADARLIGIVWSLDETKFATHTNKTVHLWAGNAEPEIVYDAGANTIRDLYWGDGVLYAIVATPLRELQIVDVYTGLVTEYTGHVGEEDLPRASFSHDGSLVASSATDGIIRVWNVATGEVEAELVGHTVQVRHMVWSPDDTRLASTDGSTARFAENASTARVWDWQNERSLLTVFAHEGIVTDIDWSSDGTRIVTTGRDNRMILWDVDSTIAYFDYTFADDIEDVAWSRTDNDILLADTGGNVRLVRLWDDIEELITLTKLCCVVRPLTVEESAVYGLPEPTSAPMPMDNEFICEGAPETRMYVGVLGRVSPESTGRLNVRQNPEVERLNLVEQLPIDTPFTVIDGPICSGDLIWYRIVFGGDAVRGWVAEGDADEYFIEPILPTP